jgi:hypothetical protein
MANRLLIVLTFSLLCGSSCSLFRPTGSEDGFYNRRNELKVKKRNGLFSSLHVSFGAYSTGNKEKGVDTRIITFKTRRSPFHFSYRDKAGHSGVAECVTTDSRDAPGADVSFISSDVQDVFYAWIGGGVNKLRNWELVMAKPTYEGMKQNTRVGVFRSLNEVFDLQANNRFSSDNSYHNMCIEFRLRGVPVAAVELNGKARIWLDSRLDEQTRFALAGALAALLMKE